MLTKTTTISSAFLFLATLAFAVDAEENADWPVYLGGKERNLYSTLEQINRDNVAKLEVAWAFETGDKAEYQANNLIVDGLLYTVGLGTLSWMARAKGVPGSVAWSIGRTRRVVSGGC